MSDTYQSPPGRHRHKCWTCGCVFEHADAAKGRCQSRLAHTCPECDSPAGGPWYCGPQHPTHHDHHLRRKPVDDDPIDRSAAVATVLGLIVLLCIATECVAPKLVPPARTAPHAKQ